jgi:hypothetical protein
MLDDNPIDDPIIRKKHQAAIDKRGPTKGRTGQKASAETKVNYLRTEDP